MPRQRFAFLIILTFILITPCLAQVPSSASLGGFEIRAGVGTDLDLGLGFGAGVAYLWRPASSSIGFEIGFDGYYSHTTDSYTDHRGNVTVTGEDKTTLTLFGMRANGLFYFSPSRKSLYFIAGIGFVIATRQWEENENAPNWLKPYHDSAEGTTAGSIVNIGLGIPLAPGLDLRIETPMLYFYSDTGKSVAFAPTATVGLTFRFR
jgi:hypothetical protein